VRKGGGRVPKSHKSLYHEEKRVKLSFAKKEGGKVRTRESDLVLALYGKKKKGYRGPGAQEGLKSSTLDERKKRSGLLFVGEEPDRTGRELFSRSGGGKGPDETVERREGCSR